MQHQKLTHYRDDLKLLVELGREEYHHYSGQILPAQKQLLHTYLWIASIMLTAELTFFIKLTEHNGNFLKTLSPTFTYSPSSFFYLLYFLGLLFSFIAFCRCIDALRDRGEFYSPYGDLVNKHALDAYNDLKSNEATPITFYTEILSSIDNAIVERINTSTIVAEKLRATSQFLLASIIICIAGTFFLIFNATLHFK